MMRIQDTRSGTMLAIACGMVVACLIGACGDSGESSGESSGGGPTPTEAGIAAGEDPEARAGVLDAEGHALKGRGELDAALQKYSACLAIHKARVRESRTPQRLQDVARALDSVAEVESKRGELKAALAASRECLEIRRGLALALGTMASRSALVRSLRTVGDLEMAHGDVNAALATYTECLILARALRLELGTTASHCDVAAMLIAIADIEHARGDSNSAINRYRECAAMLSAVWRYRESDGNPTRESGGFSTSDLLYSFTTFHNSTEYSKDYRSIHIAMQFDNASADNLRALIAALYDLAKQIGDSSSWVNAAQRNEIVEELKALEAVAQKLETDCHGDRQSLDTVASYWETRAKCAKATGDEKLALRCEGEARRIRTLLGK